MEVALYRPEIPQNTGNIGRLSVCTQTTLHIIGKPSFSLSDAAVKRAGLDYWHRLDLVTHDAWDLFEQDAAKRGKQPVLVSKFASATYSDYRFTGDEILVFGQETSGLPPEILERSSGGKGYPAVRIPVMETCRSLNLSNAVAIVLFEALRQNQFGSLLKSYRPPD